MNKRTNNKDFARRATMTLLMCMPPLGGREHWKRSKTLPRPFEGLEAFQSAKRGRLKVSEALQSAKRGRFEVSEALQSANRGRITMKMN